MNPSKFSSDFIAGPSQMASQHPGQNPGQQATGGPVPARKGLISHMRMLPKDSEIWIQGLVVSFDENEIALDDGSGIARIQFKLKRGNPFDGSDLKIGSYIMAVGKMSMRLKEHRMGMLAHTIRDLTANGPFLETCWNFETIDAALYQHEADRRNNPQLPS